MKIENDEKWNVEETKKSLHNVDETQRGVKQIHHFSSILCDYAQASSATDYN